jgi:hypothetical protein
MVNREISKLRRSRSNRLRLFVARAAMTATASSWLPARS